MVERFEIADAGFTSDARRMDNGELRIRLRASGKSTYIRTEDIAEGAWQNAHRHRGVRETYFVERGWIASAEESDGVRVVRVHFAGDVFTSQPNIDHNVYLPPGAVIHTVQYGEAVGNPDRGGHDWYPADEAFDAWSKSLGLSAVARLADVPCRTLAVLFSS